MFCFRAKFYDRPDILIFYCLWTGPNYLKLSFYQRAHNWRIFVANADTSNYRPVSLTSIGKLVNNRNTAGGEQRNRPGKLLESDALVPKYLWDSLARISMHTAVFRRPRLVHRRAGSVSVFGVGIGIRYFRRYFFMLVQYRYFEIPRYSVSVSVFIKYWLKIANFWYPTSI